MAPAIKSATTAKVIKAMGIFGGVQSLQILCSVIRTKLVAVWIGPAGVGLIALYNSTMEFLSTVSQLNLRQSAVRDLAQTADNPAKAARTTAVVRKLAFFLGLAGMLAVVLLSPALGWWSFGSASAITPFIVLSPIMLFSSLAAGDWAVMQGLGRLKELARSTLYASVASTAVAIPLFYFLRLDGIIPVLIVFAVFNALFARLMRDRHIEAVRIGLSQAWREGRGMLSLGMYLTVSYGVTLLVSYIFTAWLNRSYSTETVGYFQAGYTLVNSYAGIIFTAMAYEYFPRLSGMTMHRNRMETIVSHQIKISLCVLVPVIITLVCARELIIDILYDSSFDAALPFIAFAATGLAFRAASFCLAYTILARGDGRIYVMTEISSAALYIVLNIILFENYGFSGLGIAYIIWYFCYTAIVYAVYRFRYGMRLRKGIVPFLCLTVASGVCAVTIDWFVGPWWTAALMIPPALFFAIKTIRK